MSTTRDVLGREHTTDEQHPLLGFAGHATQESEQSLHYNLISGSAMLAQAGVWVLTALVWTAVFEAKFSFFSYHPLLNSAAILLVTQGILLLQPVVLQQHKVRGAYVHSTINLTATISLIAGLVVIEMNKASHPETRFQSLHGKMGLFVYILLAVQVLVGSAAFYVPSLFGSTERAKSLYKYHRISGYLILISMLATATFAVQTDFNHNMLHIRLWTVIAAAIVTLIGVVPRIKRDKFGFMG